MLSIAGNTHHLSGQSIGNVNDLVADLGDAFAMPAHLFHSKIKVHRHGPIPLG